MAVLAVYLGPRTVRRHLSLENESVEIEHERLDARAHRAVANSE